MKGKDISAELHKEAAGKYDAVERKFRSCFNRNNGFKIRYFIIFALEEERFVDSENMEDLYVSNVTYETCIF
jgi:hypothetical protein